MIKAFGYSRVSTEEQAREGVSLESQEAAVRAYAAMRGFQLVEVFVDRGVSAGVPLTKRKAGKALTDALRLKRAQAVISWRLDRVFRDCVDCLNTTKQWDKSGVAFHLIDLGGQAVDTSSSMGRFMLTVLAAAAELDRNKIRENTSAALRHKAKKGEFTGGDAPFGFTIGGDGIHLVKEPVEQAIIARARALHSRGYGARVIARTLLEEGFTPRQGREFFPAQVDRMLKRKAA